MYPTPYEQQLDYVLKNGQPSEDRTGTGTIRIFGTQARYPLTEYFPLLTSKKVHWKSVVGELLWMLSGDTNIKALNDQGITIWDEWADENGDLGPVYGRQWRAWPHTSMEPLGMGQVITKRFIDQIKFVVDEIKINPSSRRLIVSAWNPGELQDMALMPCHTLFQFFVQDEKLSCQLYQRSADMFLGVPFNIASYALLTHLIAKCCGLGVGDFVHTIGDAHIYSNHFEQVKEQLSRDPKPLPQLAIHGERTYPWEYKPEDIELIGYNPHSTIKAQVAV